MQGDRAGTSKAVGGQGIRNWWENSLGKTIMDKPNPLTNKGEKDSYAEVQGRLTKTLSMNSMQ